VMQSQSSRQYTVSIITLSLCYYFEFWKPNAADSQHFQKNVNVVTLTQSYNAEKSMKPGATKIQHDDLLLWRIQPSTGIQQLL